MDKDNPIQNNSQNQDKWIKLGFFSGDQNIAYVFKKIEKISAALYVVSGLLKDSEPLKWELREKGIYMLSASLSMNGIEPNDKGSLVQTIFSSTLEITTLLNISLVGGLISAMNHSILLREIDSVVSILKDRVVEDTNKAGYILSDTFFKTDEPSQQTLSSTTSTPTPVSLSGFTTTSATTNSKNASKNVLNKSESIKDKKDDKKDQRRQDIMGLLRKESNLSVKDFIKVVPNCSEKTIQRELLELVEKGLIKKVGERRWSRYSIK